jgi:hypothetical protein
MKRNILCPIIYFRKSCRLWDDVEKYGGAREATNDNTTHALCVLDKQGHSRSRVYTRLDTHARARAHTQTHTQICNTYTFSTAKMIRERASMLHYTHIACLVHVIGTACGVVIDYTVWSVFDNW